jgi:hypothetical protein
MQVITSRAFNGIGMRGAIMPSLLVDRGDDDDDLFFEIFLCIFVSIFFSNKIAHPR